MFMEAYKLSISYDMENFGEELDLIIYDSKCQIADPDSNPPIFALKVKYLLKDILYFM